MKNVSKTKRFKISNVIASIAAIIFLILGCTYTYIKVITKPTENNPIATYDQNDNKKLEEIGDLEKVNQNIATSTSIIIDVYNTLMQCISFGLGIVFLLYVLNNKDL